jgi:hypothetical protein
MGKHINFIVSRWRGGWSVNVDADRVSDHPDLARARAAAEALNDQARRHGDSGSTLDFTKDEKGPADP